jgi:diguanylate cyclase (GGDEF)-like protein/PAS domain S-box-containing protein
MPSPRIFLRVLVFLIIAFGALALASGGYSAWRLSTRLTTEHEGKALAIAQTLAANLARDVTQANGAAEPLDGLLQHIDTIDGVSYVLVTDSAGRPMAHTFAGEVPQPLLTATMQASATGIRRISAAESQSYLDGSCPVAGTDLTVHVGMDHRPVQSAMHSSILDHQILALAFFTLFALAAWVYTNRLTRPLRHLADYARQVRGHNFTADLSITSDDEVGDAARAIRSTTRELAGSIASLKKSADDATTRLSDTQSTFTAIMNTTADGIVVTNRMGVIRSSNPALLDMFLLSEQELRSRTICDLLHKSMDDIATLTGISLSARADTPATKRRGTAEFETVLGDLEFPIELSVSVIPRGPDADVVFIIRDITERKFVEEQLREAHDRLERRVCERTAELEQANAKLKAEILEREIAENALREAEADYRSIFENATEGIFRIAPNGTYTDANPAMARIFGYDTPAELLTAFSALGASPLLEEGEDRPFMRKLLTNWSVSNHETRARRRDGQIIWVAFNARCVRNKRGEILHFEGSVDDITRRKEYEAQLKHQAFHDPLTSLPNRSLFLNHLDMSMRRKKRSPETLFAVLYLDLDRFKVINDSLGHTVGDLLLTHVAKTLTTCVRDVDTVARFGGDEFAVLLDDVSAPRESIKVAKRILHTITRPTRLGGCEVFTAASIGIVFISEDYADAESILRDADTAMYRAKEQGRGRFKVFNNKMHCHAVRQLKLETDLRRSLDQQDFELYYQPIVDLGTGQMSGLEALIRWNHPELGRISPDDFIPIAEDTGLIIPLGAWVLTEVCRQVRQWHDACGLRIPVSVNLSARQFMMPTLLGDVRDILRDTGAPPHLLKFEITETVLMQNAPVAVETLGRLREMGILISMDDFGTGYSLFSYLVEFPIDVIKIDRSLVSRICTDADCGTIVRSIVGLAQNLGFSAVAEGVEIPEQADKLRGYDCPCAQGFYFSQPVPAREAESLLAAANLRTH